MSLQQCYSPAFLALRNFDGYYTFRKGEKLIKMLCNHKRYNSPPFSHLDSRWPRAAFLITGSNYAVVDLDHCFREGQPKAWAAVFLRRWTQLTAHEISVSGNGAHILFHVIEPIPPELKGIHLWDSDGDGKAELYVDTKWIALTGRPVFGTAHPEVLRISIAELQSLMQELLEIRPRQRAVGGMKQTEDGPLPPIAKAFDIEKFLEWLDIPVRAVEGTFYRLRYCPWSSRDESSTHFIERCLTNPAITHGATLGFVCHHPECSQRNISDVMRWARENGRGQCPTPLWEEPIFSSAADIFGKNPFPRAAEIFGKNPIRRF